MITINSKPKDIRREIAEDEEKAKYWFVKTHHGQSAFEKWCMSRQRWMEVCGDIEFFSDPVEYVSKNGNHWMVFLYIVRTRTGFVHTLRTVAYYTTAISIGAWVSVFSRSADGKREDGCIFYTPHFFQRFSSRLGISVHSRDLLIRFMHIVPFHGIYETARQRSFSKERDVVMPLPASYAEGTYRMCGDYYFCTIRSFEPVTALSPRQRQELEQYSRHHHEHFDDNINNIVSDNTPKLR